MSCESRLKTLEGRWVTKSLSSTLLEEDIDDFPKNMREQMRKHKDSVMQSKVNTMYVEFEMNNHKGTKGILHTNMYENNEAVLWRYLEKDHQIHLYDPNKKDRYWNIVEFTDATLTIQMHDGKNDWAICFIRENLRGTRLRLAQK